MPRYFFDILDGKQIVDDEGMELPDADAAIKLLIRSTGEHLRDSPEVFFESPEWAMQVRDESGRVLMRLDLKSTKYER